MMNEQDKVRLADMLVEARRVQTFIRGKKRTDLEDDLLSYAVRHAITLIGEAAAQVTDETQQELPTIEWRNITGMRNFVIHHYRRVNLDILWETATQSVSHLIAQLEVILKNNEADP